MSSNCLNSKHSNKSKCSKKRKLKETKREKKIRINEAVQLCDDNKCVLPKWPRRLEVMNDEEFTAYLAHKNQFKSEHSQKTHHIKNSSRCDHLKCSDENHSTSDIPGFYYDSEKKKYFRILPNHNTHNTSIVTNDSIKSKEGEMLRKQSIKEFESKGNLSGAHLFKRYSPLNSSKSRNLSIFRECVNKTLTSSFNKQTVINSLFSSLSLNSKGKIYQQNDELFTNIRSISKCKLSNDHKKLLCLFSVDDNLGERLQAFKLSSFNKAKSGRNFDVNIKSTGAAVVSIFANKVISDFSWATSGVSDMGIIFISSCNRLQGDHSKVTIVDLSQNSLDLLGTSFPLENIHDIFILPPGKAAWTCSWCEQHRKISAGLEGCSYIVDIETRNCLLLDTKNSDVFTQCFDPNTGNTLYSGTRNGRIYTHDFRTNSSRYQICLRHSMSTSHLYPMKNGSQIISSDFKGKIMLWDLRYKKVVLQYAHGVKNSHSILPFSIDEYENLLCAVGEDKYTSIWDLNSGSLLNKIPPPRESFNSCAPSVNIFSSGLLGSPGVLMGVDDEFMFYSSRKII